MRRSSRRSARCGRASACRPRSIRCHGRSYVGQANKQAFSAFLFGWGTGTAEASDPLIAQNATFNPTKGWGASNRGRYSNPELDKLIEQAVGTADDAAREKLLQQAQRLAFDDVAIIPLHIQKNIWATRAGLTYVPTVGEDLRWST